MAGERALSKVRLVRNYIARHPQLAARVPDLSLGVQRAEQAESISGVLARQLDSAEIPYLEEHRFHLPRRWRTDFFFEAQRLAVEIEGINHRKRDRYGRDLEKYNALSQGGIFLLRFTARQVHDGVALREILAYLEAH